MLQQQLQRSLRQLLLAKQQGVHVRQMLLLCMPWQSQGTPVGCCQKLSGVVLS
jgi:hypothetical protein